MALRITYWQKDEPTSDKDAFSEIKHIVLKRKSEVEERNLVADRPLGTALVTLDRTDRQSVHETELWRDARYR